MRDIDRPNKDDPVRGRIIVDLEADVFVVVSWWNHIPNSPKHFSGIATEWEVHYRKDTSGEIVVSIHLRGILGHTRGNKDWHIGIGTTVRLLVPDHHKRLARSRGREISGLKRFRRLVI